MRAIIQCDRRMTSRPSHDALGPVSSVREEWRFVGRAGSGYSAHHPTAPICVRRRRAIALLTVYQRRRPTMPPDSRNRRTSPSAGRRNTLVLVRLQHVSPRRNGAARYPSAPASERPYARRTPRTHGHHVAAPAEADLRSLPWQVLHQQREPAGTSPSISALRRSLRPLPHTKPSSQQSDPGGEWSAVSPATA